MYRLGENDNYGFGYRDGSKGENRLKVIGKGIVSVKPDAAEVVLGVVTENTQLEIAQEENSRTTQQVIKALESKGVLPKHMQTKNYNIRPNYDYINGAQIFRGYEVTNNLNILIKNIDSAGEIIDEAVKNGANSISGINFIVSDQTKYYHESLRLAVEDAQNKANVIANKLKVKLNRIPVQIVEEDRGALTPYTTMAVKSAVAGTPIEAGENKITSEIEALFIYN